MAKTKEERLNEVHADALREFDKVQTACRDERLQCLQDRRFYSVAGAMWEGPLGTQFENKPKFEINKIHLAVIRIFNEYRNNRIDVLFQAKDGSDAGDLAETCASLYRADEHDSCADEAKDNAFEEAVGGGFGAWRLRAEYEDEEDDDNDEQRIRIEPIFDADSCVFFDLDAKRQDKSDATKCWVLSAMSRDGYIDKYGDDPSSWAKQIHQSQFDWLTPDVVYVAEYYRIEQTNETVHVFRGLDDSERRVTDAELAEAEDLQNELDATGWREVRQKKTKRRRCHKYIMSGSKVLEDEGYIAGKNIPIVPVYGKRWYIDNVERCMGHVRLAKDPARVKNMQVSKLAEISAMSSIEKPIFTREQMGGHEQMWADDNVKDYPYLLVNQLTDANGQPVAIGPAAYTRSPQIPPAMAALLQITEQDQQDLLGKQEAGEQMQPNMSGRAIELIQGRLDMQTFIYISNFGKAVRRSGEIWLSMAKEIYVEEGRKMKGINDRNEPSQIELRRPIVDEKTGEAMAENDLDDAVFDVDVEIGPSSASKRQATVRGLMGMMQITVDPDTLTVLSAMAMMNMEGEGLRDTNKYFRKKLLGLGAVEPTEEEAQEMAQAQQGQQPDPNAVFLQASAGEADAKAVKARAETLLAVAKAEETKVRAAKAMQGLRHDETKHIIDTVNGISQLGGTPGGNGSTRPAP